MKKNVLSLLSAILLFAGCSSCATFNEDARLWGVTSGVEERHNQEAMKESVFILKKIAYMDVNVDDIQSKSELKVAQASGTGFVVDVDRKLNESLVMTAQHVCVVSDSITKRVDDSLDIELPVVLTQIKIRDIEGVWHDTVQIYADEENDVCVLKVLNFSPRNVATLADRSFTPTLGSKLMTAGAPTGEFDVHTSIIVEGIMSGFELFNNITHLTTSIPVAGGASGSAVNQGGRVVGMVVMVNSRFHHISYLVMADHLVDGLAEARTRWHQKNTQKSQP